MFGIAVITIAVGLFVMGCIMAAERLAKPPGRR